LNVVSLTTTESLLVQRRQFSPLTLIMVKIIVTQIL